MSFNLKHLTLVSVSVLALSVLNGCSSMNSAFSGASRDTVKSASNYVDPYDSYYGSPASASHDAKYRPKLVRTVKKPVFKTTAPKRYVVKKGDTLWDISNKFLNNPAYWPEVWDKNQKVRNPHRIYPGDVLFIYQGPRKIKMADGSVVEKMVPQLRVEGNGDGEPISTYAPFLAWPRVLDDDTINNAPYIVDARGANMLIEENMTVYLKNLADRHAGGEYAIFNVGDPIFDPESGREFGREVIYTGSLNVEVPARGADVATANVIDAKREIRRGDRVLYAEDYTHNLEAPITAPRHRVRGTIISLFDAEMITGQTQIITINKGARDGLKNGHTLGVYSPGRTVNDPIARTQRKHLLDTQTAVTVDLPPERAATAIVYRVLNDISYALLTDSSHEVKHGYKIGNP